LLIKIISEVESSILLGSHVAQFDSLVTEAKWLVVRELVRFAEC